MGFMNFKNKSKNTGLDNLDIPPPPPLDDFSMNAQYGAATQKIPQQNSNFSQSQKQPIFPNMPQQPNFELPSQPKQEFIMPDFEMPAPKQTQNSKQIPDDFPIFDKPEQQVPKLKSFNDLFDDSVNIQNSMPAQRHISNLPNTSQENKIFIEVTKYKGILTDLSNIKKSLKQSDEEVHTLIGDIEEEEKIFNKIRGNLSDVEEKLAVLEQSIFNN